MRVGEQQREESLLGRRGVRHQGSGEDGGERAEGDRLGLVELVQEDQARQPRAGTATEKVWIEMNGKN